MSRRSKTRDEMPTKIATQPSVVQAVFDPDGDIIVRAIAASGNVYEIKPRTSFKIAGEDVDWFFYEWDWQWRQCLCRSDDYQPKRPQFDNGAANLKANVEEPERPQFDNGAATIAAARAQEPVTESETSSPAEPITNMEPEESAPNPIAAVDSEDEDKE